MITISADEMQQDLPGYLRLVETGETLIITRGSEPVAQIQPLPPTSHEPRPFGLCKGDFKVPTDFDSPLPAEILDAFEGR
jgi:prevent-host-death family protein